MTDVKEQDLSDWSTWLETIDMPAYLLDRSFAFICKNSRTTSFIRTEGAISDMLTDVHLKDEGTRDDGTFEVPGPMGKKLVGRSIDDRTLVLIADRESTGQARSVCGMFSMISKLLIELDRKKDKIDVYHELFTHDAPNFITAVYGYIQMMNSMDLPRDKQLKYLNASIVQTEALNRLIDNVRTIKRLESAPSDGIATIDIGAEIDDVVAEALERYSSKRPQIEDQVPRGDHIMNLEPEVITVFKIVLDNSIKYSDEPKVTISIGPGSNDKTLHILISDNGRGIPDEKKDFVFQRFDMLDKQRKIRGSGISLALAGKVIERNGGKIWVTNRIEGDPAKGSIFHIMLNQSSGALPSAP